MSPSNDLLRPIVAKFYTLRIIKSSLTMILMTFVDKYSKYLGFSLLTADSTFSKFRRDRSRYLEILRDVKPMY